LLGNVARDGDPKAGFPESMGIEAGQYAIDSTGFSTAVYDRWFFQKHGKLCSQNVWVERR
jgi:hypothetical protein